jgi:DNA-directed RNA polymerase subunit RPC12/RpoP
MMVSEEERIAHALKDDRILCPSCGRVLNDIVQVGNSVCRIEHVYVWQGDRYDFDHTAEHEVVEYNFMYFECPYCSHELSTEELKGLL